MAILFSQRFFAVPYRQEAIISTFDCFYLRAKYQIENQMIEQTTLLSQTTLDPLVFTLAEV